MVNGDRLTELMAKGRSFDLQSQRTARNKNCFHVTRLQDFGSGVCPVKLFWPQGFVRRQAVVLNGIFLDRRFRTAALHLRSPGCVLRSVFGALAANMMLVQCNSDVHISFACSGSHGALESSSFKGIAVSLGCVFSAAVCMIDAVPSGEPCSPPPRARPRERDACRDAVTGPYPTTLRLQESSMPARESRRLVDTLV